MEWCGFAEAFAHRRTYTKRSAPWSGNWINKSYLATFRLAVHQVSLITVRANVGFRAVESPLLAQDTRLRKQRLERLFVIPLKEKKKREQSLSIVQKDLLVLLS